MHIIKRQPFDTAIALYPEYKTAIDATYRTLKKANVSTPEQLKAIFPSLDNFKYKDKWYVIDIGGGSFRLIAFIEFTKGKLYVKHIVTHDEYDKIVAQHRGKKKR